MGFNCAQCSSGGLYYRYVSGCFLNSETQTQGFLYVNEYDWIGMIYTWIAKRSKPFVSPLQMLGNTKMHNVVKGRVL